nr:helix-turn-helix transcriptional regulator [uncultured Anaerocolumna sp.]
MKDLRNRYKLSPSELSNELGFSNELYKSIEIGNIMPSFSDLITIADYYYVSIDYLMGRSDSEGIYYVDANTNSNIQKFIIETIRKQNINKISICESLDINEALFDQKLINNDFTINDLLKIIKLLNCTYQGTISLYDKNKEQLTYLIFGNTF